MAKVYPLAILGTGMAGLTASIYASRYGIKHILIGEVPGGNVSEAILVENYPGFEKIKGIELVERLRKQALKYKPAWLIDKIKLIKRKDGFFVIITKDNKEIRAKYLIVALGTKKRMLGVKGEKELLGRGVHFCPTCDGYFYKEKIVAVVGGGDSGATASLYLARISKKVYLIDILKKMKAMPFWQAKIKKTKNIELKLGYKIEELKGDGWLKEIVLSKRNKKEIIKADGVFIEIGGIPNSEIVKKLGVELDKNGYIEVKNNMQTTNPYIFAAGDISTGSDYFNQMITSASEGAIAAHSVYELLQKNK